MLEALGALPGLWLQGLVNASWQGALVALAVLGLLRLVPKLSPSFRAAALWLVCLRFALAALVPLGFALPLRAAPPPPAAAERVAARDEVAPLGPAMEVATPPRPASA